jgi:hypothetical protein
MHVSNPFGIRIVKTRHRVIRLSFYVTTCDGINTDEGSPRPRFVTDFYNPPLCHMYKYYKN